MKYILAKTLIIGALASGLLGCGAHYNKNGNRESTPLYSVTASAAEISNYNCPANSAYNVTAAPGTTHVNASYKVCRSQSDAGRFLISGYTSSEIICIYPAQRAAGAAQAVIIGEKKCHYFSSTGLVTQLPTATNYVFIVDSDDTMAMEAALAGASEYPPFTGGSVR
jgi:hypothetical protein